MMMDDDDVPPLEDMSDMLKHAKERREKMEAMKPVVTPVPIPKKVQQPPEAKTAFSGIKKGFFNASPKKQSIPRAVEPQTLKPTKTKEDSLRFDQVQEVMKQQLNMLNKQEWLTPDFLERIERNPALARAFADPLFTQATEDLKRDPEKAFQKYAKERPDIMLALREFAGTTSIPPSIVSITTPTIPDELPDHEKELVKRVMQDKELQVLHFRIS
ncbi:hypothetical protein BC829DRAFT_397089 [Chytridium lagenaria]|nr:hypothetical protein BC829DRAFT_397089 [Chytridium lagenaria]